MDTLSLYGNIASLAGCALSVVSVIVSIVVAWNVRAIRRHYTFIGRGDDFLLRLQEHSADLTSSLNDFALSVNMIGGHLAKLKATLEFLVTISPDQQRKAVQKLLKQVHRYSLIPTFREIYFWLPKQSEKEGLRLIYNELLYITQLMTDAKENAKWQI